MEARSQEARMGRFPFWLLASWVLASFLVIDYRITEVILKVIQVEVVLLANVFLEFGTLVPWDIPRYAPRFRVGTRIIDHRFVMQRALVGTCELLDDMQLIGVRMAEVIEPCSFIETDH